MALTETKLRGNLRSKVVAELIEIMTEKGEEVLQTKTNQFCFPCKEVTNEFQLNFNVTNCY